MKNFKIDNISLGTNIETVELSNYKMIPYKVKKYNYQFDNISFAHDEDGNITLIDGHAGKVDIPYGFKNIKDVVNHFNVDYKELEYDKEQDINMVKYVDSKNKLGLTFFYSTYDGGLIWIELYSLNEE